MAGKIIVIEGTDGSGKETQSVLLEKRLNSQGIKCVKLSFPMYDTPTGKIVGGAYLGKEGIGSSYFKEGSINVDPHIACLYYAADRKYNIEKVNKLIENDYYVILDRYTPSNLAHQGSKIKDQEERFNMYQWIDKLEYWLLKLPKPDKTILLYVPYEYTNKLRQDRLFEDEHEASEDHLKNAEQAYIELSELYNWNKIDCIKDGKLRDIEDINDEIISIINTLK